MIMQNKKFWFWKHEKKHSIPLKTWVENMFQKYLFEIWFKTYNESTGHVGLGPAWVKENSQLKSTDASTNIYRYLHTV